MGSRAIQALLVLACVQLSASNVEEVKPRWIYNDDNTKSLPDFIKFDLQLDERGKINLNLVKQPMESNKPPLIISESEGQSSTRKLPEFMGTYKDPFFDASATVTIREIGGSKEIDYIITLTHDDKSISLGPKAIFVNDPILNNEEEDATERGDIIRTRLLNVDGVLHALFETPLKESMQSRNFDEDYVSGELTDTRIDKRSDQTQMKRLMTLEIFTMMEYSIYKKFFEGSKATTDEDKSEDAIKTIIYIFSHIMEKVKSIFEKIEAEHKFTIKWIGTFISKNASDTPFIERYLIDQRAISIDALGDFDTWISNIETKNDKRFKFPNYDHFVLFTSYKIMDKDKSMLLGLSLGSVCLFQSQAIVRANRFFETVTNLVHELGHSLGAGHDEREECDPGDYVMAASLKHHTNDDLHKSFYFSKCSVRGMISKVYYLDVMAMYNCLTREANSNFQTPQTDLFSDLYPGQIYDPDDQCRMANGHESRYEGGDENLCQVLKCTHGEELRALDGTTCANRAWCRRGKCEQNNMAPRAPDSCVNGDYKMALPKSNTSLNENIIQCKDADNDPDMCTSEIFKRHCCASCAGNRTMNGGCQDTIKECQSLEPRDCYYDFYATACCKSCHALVQNPLNLNCLYGDKGIDCSDLVPAMCHLSTQFCCQTCTTYFSSTNNVSVIQMNAGDSSTASHPSTILPIASSKTTVFSMSSDTTTDICESDDAAPLKYFTCPELVEFNHSLCETKTMKTKCCKSCERFNIKL